ncbi:hypothetical protein [Paraburkholderia humisilvae]|uniref:hypothetical protein n=1 Tax=Paraburkholderia humisilvae TaxID=627669 RepID=UPI00158282C5|nr:hypothetical protein [Paraburkholderia humisilvae]
MRITEIKAVTLNRVDRRYNVTWFLHEEGHFVPANVIASFSEPLDFVSPEEALGFAERRAHTFADCAFTAHEGEKRRQG